VFEAVARRLVGEPRTEPETAPDDAVSGSSAPHPLRPKIGLVLGGGAARGWAHIGVLRALQEAGIVPDIVCGTSIGAVVGGCYLSGHLDHLEDWARSITRRKIFSLLDVSFGGSGLISGSKLVDLLEETLQEVAIEDLDRKFVCVATELATGHEIWLRTGKMAEAMRASFALPGIFEPISIGGRWLVDGALVNPIPVSACRALDARCVIAVGLHNTMSSNGSTIVDPLIATKGAGRTAASANVDKKSAKKLWRRQMVGRGDLPGIPGVMIESFNIIQDRISRSRLAGDPPDTLITPKLGSIGLFDFHRADAAIAIGYENAIRVIDDVHAQLEMLAA